jgi:hypothetical protein
MGAKRTPTRHVILYLTGLQGFGPILRPERSD